MELEERKAIHADILGAVHTPWYERHKITLWILLAVTGIALVLVIIFASVKCVTCAIGSPSSEYLIDSQSLVWNGICRAEGSQCITNSQKGPPLLIVSMDGFRAEYLRRGLTPTLQKIAQCGVKAEYMYPVYPTKTFPNHYSIVTGLYPSSHGIIDNTMYDTNLSKLFKVGKTPLDDPRWWQKEPIWVTAQKQGKKAATFFWPGSDVRINGFFPNIYHPFNKSIPMETRVDQVVEWLSSPNYPDFVTLYLEEPDSAAHTYSPNSQEVNDALKRVDGLLSRLLAGLESRNLTDCVNILLVSDHGMSDIDCDRVIDIRENTNITNVFSLLGTFGRLKPNENSTSVDDLISTLKCHDKHLRVYKKEELPVRMHYVENERIEPIILDIDLGYQLVDQNVRPRQFKCSGGSHGYDNIFSDMSAIFFAYGPSFKKNITIPPFLNIELYELMCEVAGIDPQPNNGTRGSLHHILKYPPELERQETAPAPPVAEVPVDDPVIQSRVDFSNCSCLQIPDREMDAAVIENKTRLHLPFGIPTQDSRDLVLLYNSDYILAYDKKYNFPLWTGFTINEIKNASEREICWSSDVRVENATCSNAPEGFIHRPLYPPQFSEIKNKRENYYVTNSILKSVNHSSVLEPAMIHLMEKYASEKGPLNVMVGPAFNPQSNRRSDATIPSHIFAILTWCSLPLSDLIGCNSDLLDTVAFLLPNFPYVQNCESAEDTLKKNVARVKDIEEMTGLSFYTHLATIEAVRLRTSMSHHSFES